MLGPTIETERLVLRPPAAEDFDAWATFYEDADALKYIGGAQVRSVAWRTFLQAGGGWALQGFALFSVLEKSTGRWIGRVGPHFPEGWPGPEVGWAIAREVWGRGYAFEAAAAAMDYVFDTLGWNEVIHCIAPENLASRRLAAAPGLPHSEKGGAAPAGDERRGGRVGPEPGGMARAAGTRACRLSEARGPNDVAHSALVSTMTGASTMSVRVSFTCPAESVAKAILSYSARSSGSKERKASAEVGTTT